VLLKPTQGAHQKTVPGVILHETATQITVQAECFNGNRFRKSDGLPVSKFDPESFPRYKAQID
jgi:hypothetical protein